MMTWDDRESAGRRRAAQPAIDLIHDFAHRAHRLARLPDGTADHQEIRARMNRRGAIDELVRALADAWQWRHDDEAPSANAADARGSRRRGVNSVEAGGGSMAREFRHPLDTGNRAGFRALPRHAHQHRNRNDVRLAQSFVLAEPVDFGAHLRNRFSMPIEVNVEHAHTEARRFQRGAHQRAWGVMKFQIEEDLGTAPANLANEF